MLFNKKFYIVVLLDNNNIVVLSNKALNGNTVCTDNYCFGKRVKSILGFTYDKDEAELVKDRYINKENKENDIVYAVLGEYPRITVSKYYFVAKDNYNYCLKHEVGTLTIIDKSKVFKKIEDAIIYQNQLIQEKDCLKSNYSITIPNENLMSISAESISNKKKKK